MRNWKEAKQIRDSILNAKVITVNGVYIPSIIGKGYIHDRFSCDCGWTDKSNWEALRHEFTNPSHKMRQNW